MLLNLESLSNHAKTVFLASLAGLLTVYARETYEVGTDRVAQPELLRAYNELLHRVTDAVREHVQGSEGYSLEAILAIVTDFGRRNGRTREMQWVVEQAAKSL